MKNRYEVRGDVTAIYITASGKIKEFIIDTADLEKAKSFPNTWRGIYNRCMKGHYVGADYKGKTILFHRFLMEPPDDMVVDHINHDILDNRRSNLRIITFAENHQNRSGAYITSKSGVRGVNWSKDKQKYIARIKADGKRIFIGYFNDLKEAEKAVKEARRQYMPYSEEALNKAVI